MITDIASSSARPGYPTTFAGAAQAVHLRPSHDMTSIAVIGLGAMGSRIARRLVDAGHGVLVWNRDPAKAAAFERRARTPAEAAQAADVVLTMVADEAALEDVTQFAEDAAFALVQMSTIGRAATERLAGRLPEHVELLDAPVLGSIAEAEAGTLRIFAGGSAALVERLSPLLGTLGTVVHVGEVGAGSAAKLVANFALLSSVAALGESIALADDLGLARAAAFDVLAATPLGAQAERRRTAVETGAYAPRFTLALAEKDARLVRDAASERPLAAATQEWFTRALAAGRGADDYTAVVAEILARL
jgi:3-hydroxyisobutyrate dehydrogenase-like beta-hydroxyacid dehydrogenase